MPTEPDPESPSDPLIDIRPSPIAGRWYSDSPHQLSREIDYYMGVSLPELGGKVVALVAPHAGYRYSGATAGYAFAAVRGRSFSRVAVLSPLHGYHPAPVLTSGHSAYKTPLGEVPVDHRAVEALQNKLSEQNILMPRLRYDEEHSLEIELPFLQRALPNPFTLIPLMFRSQSADVLQTVARALFDLIDGTDTLLVASTDLSHFFPLGQARKLDTAMLRHIERLSPEEVLSAERSGDGMACGSSAVAVALWSARLMGADQAVILHQTTSAEMTGDTDSVVGYGAAALVQKTS